MTRWVVEHIKDRYGVEPDFPFEDMGETAVFRNRYNQKWFGIIMKALPLSRLGLDTQKRADVINLKCDPMISFTVRDLKGIFPAYHMNKEHWITVLLDGTVACDLLESLISISYRLVEQKHSRRPKKANKTKPFGEKNMNDECLICGAPLVYSQKDIELECALCHKKENSKTFCKNGHYVCNECHLGGVDAIIGTCLGESSKDPAEILKKLMALPFCHMHGPEHHIMVGACLLTAYKNAGGKIDLPKALIEMQSRAKKIPGGACGFWGACGAGISAGMFVSIASGSTPLANKEWGLSNQMTAKALGVIGEIGGPRCCKRDSYLAVARAVEFAKTHLGVEMELGKIKCTHSAFNNQCIGERCPFK